jgi:pyruvate/2-oxoglutarate/acetoin dehydrogenase E1 component
MRAATRRHAVNILKCFRASPGSNYVVCKSLEDVDQKFKQAKRLGAPVVFVEASEDAKESARLVETTLADETSARESAKAKAVSFETATTRLTVVSKNHPRKKGVRSSAAWWCSGARGS